MYWAWRLWENGPEPEKGFAALARVDPRPLSRAIRGRFPRLPAADSPEVFLPR